MNWKGVLLIIVIEILEMFYFIMLYFEDKLIKRMLIILLV